jgi:DNA-binding ferritin-like protein (Dps family)
MLDSFLKLIIGDLNEKRAYKEMVKRVDRLPKDYRFAFRKIQHYMFTVGAPDGDVTIFTDLSMFTDLVELFEISAAEGKKVLDVIGIDAGKFSDEFMRVYTGSSGENQNKLNKEISDRLNEGGNNDV